MRVVIAGAGIAGLTTALSLNAAGLSLTRFDGQGRCVDLIQAAWHAGSESLPVASNAAGLR